MTCVTIINSEDDNKSVILLQTTLLPLVAFKQNNYTKVTGFSVFLQQIGCYKSIKALSETIALGIYSDDKKTS